ncbi:helix-turn-helix domain-containing protein [Burkholderia cenocepacia]|nr:helix-turn-helix domain-containing protein [Burkholderia cenocepacia]MCW3539313.1 helix-turn-helix domain-containing protein [Burkholderia cenocepacia]
MDLKAYLSSQRGRLVSLSRAIGAYASDVSAWASGARPVPLVYGVAIERATGGIVTRHDIFSADVIARVWPELVRQEGEGA